MDYLESEANELQIQLAHDFLKGQSVSLEDILADMQVERRYRQINEIEHLYRLFNYSLDPKLLAAIHSARCSVNRGIMSDGDSHAFLVLVSSQIIPTLRYSGFERRSGVAWRMVVTR
jgi:hypothetical protein